MYKGESNSANPMIVTLVSAFPELHGKCPISQVGKQKQ